MWFTARTNSSHVVYNESVGAQFSAQLSFATQRWSTHPALVTIDVLRLENNCNKNA